MPVATLWRLAYALEVDVSYFFAGLLDETAAPVSRPQPMMAATVALSAVG
jgi:hypothetical protein